MKTLHFKIRVRPEGGIGFIEGYARGVDAKAEVARINATTPKTRVRAEYLGDDRRKDAGEKENDREKDYMGKFLDLATRLSPEWLTCDGTLSNSKVKARRAQILREWAALEKKVGVTMTEDEVWEWLEKTKEGPFKEVI